MEKTYLKNCLNEVTKKVHGVTRNSPNQRKLFKQGFSFSILCSEEQLKVWDYIWNNSTEFWVKANAFFYCESKSKKEEFLIYSWQTISKWQNSVDCWALCDGLSKIYTKILELKPNDVLTQLIRWNNSANLWDRRQSLVSLLYFSRTKKLFLPYKTIINLVDNLIHDKEYYVQKAVGWSLKELSCVYPIETLDYFQKHIKEISSTAFTIAIEKINKKEKDILKELRK